jgi:uncharacterized protein with PhoU and TrkA domain
MDQRDVLRQTACMDEDLRRLETKVDKLTEAVMRLVLLEERQSTQAERIVSLETRLKSNEEHVREADAKIDRWVNRGVGMWAFAALMFTLVEFGMSLFRR